MAFLALLFLGAAYSQDFPTENKAEKFNACYYITKLKLSLDKSSLNAVLENHQDQEKAGNKISTDMLLKCYKAITLEMAVHVLQQGEELYFQDEFEALVGVDYESYKGADMEFTEEHMNFFQEIKKVKEDAEEAAEKPPAPTPPLPPVGIWYVVVVIAVFAAFFYWASRKVLATPEPKGRRGKKRN